MMPESSREERTKGIHDVNINISANEILEPKKPNIVSRATTQHFTNSLSLMSKEQRVAVVEMGFGHILNFNIKEIPVEMIHWLVKNFDPVTKEINLIGGRKLRIEMEDVYRVLGFPKGKFKISNKKFGAKHKVLIEWTSKFGSDKNRIGFDQVVKAMLKETDGGLWFRRHFLVLLTASFIENSYNGYILPPIMHHLEDLSSVPNLNWCGYLLSKLVHFTEHWQNTKRGPFRGPSLFLVAFYVDRVEVYHDEMSRRFPTCLNWDVTKLRDRQTKELEIGGFGRGYPRDPIDKSSYVDYNENDGTNEKLGEENKTDETDVELKKFAKEFVSVAQNAAEWILKLGSMVEIAPMQFQESTSYKKLYKSSEKMIGFGACTNIGGETDDGGEGLDDKAYETPEFIAAVQKIEDAIMKREQYKRHSDEMPSFSLGLTQEFGNPFSTTDTQVGDIQGVVNTNLVEVEHVEHSDKETKIVDDANNTNGYCKRPLKKSKMVPTPIEQLGRMETRNTRKSKVAGTLKSPWIVRNVNASEKLTIEEKKLWLFAVHNDDDNIEDILFQYCGVLLRRREVMTLKHESLINIGIIDVWSTIMNINEQKRSPDSPLRFFATTDPTLKTLYESPDTWTVEDKFRTFSRKMEAELSGYNHINLGSVDIFVFPIFHNNHFFVIYFNVKMEKITIIDNQNMTPAAINGNNYGEEPIKLRDMLVKFVESKGHSSIGFKLSTRDVEIMPCIWADTENYVDCGVYAMRHMETFMGDNSSKWNPSLSRNNKKQLDTLRIKYAGKICGEACNEVSEVNKSKANARYRKICIEGGASIDSIM